MRGSLLTVVAVAMLCQAGAGQAQDTASLPPAPDPPAPDPRLVPAVPLVQTLQEALVLTYQTNPTLMGQRAALRVLDSGAALARAAGHPQVSVSASFDQEVFVHRQFGTRGRNFAATADVEQVLFAGGRIKNAVRAADTRVIAGRADLRAIENEILSEAVSVYADLTRDRQIRDFNLDLVRVLTANLESTRSRLSVGDVTRTDVSQSEARLALAQSNLATAEGRLDGAEENFERVVGVRAGVLEPLPPLPSLPQTAEQAVEVALADNPDIAAFVGRARAAGYDAAAAKAERLPIISATSSTLYNNALGTADAAAGAPNGTLFNSAASVQVGVTLRMPLYQGGAASARVRQAEEFKAQLMEQAIAAERAAVAGTRAAFATYRTSAIAITASEAAVAANEVAITSVKVEQTVGARSVLDVLNAEQELLNSRIALAAAKRETYVAAFTLLTAMGAAEAADLGVRVNPLYDPRANYKAYGRSWSDWNDGPSRMPVSTRTVPDVADSPLTRMKTDTPNDSEKKP